MIRTGFAAYLGMLEVEIYHTHPLLKAFIMVLREQALDTKLRGDGKHTHVTMDPGCKEFYVLQWLTLCSVSSYCNVPRVESFSNFVTKYLLSFMLTSFVCQL